MTNNLNDMTLDDSELEKIKEIYIGVLSKAKTRYKVFKWMKMLVNIAFIIVIIFSMHSLYLITRALVMVPKLNEQIISLAVVTILMIFVMILTRKWILRTTNGPAKFDHSNVKLIKMPNQSIKITQIIKTEDYIIGAFFTNQYIVFRRIDNPEQFANKAQRYKSGMQSNLITKIKFHFHYIDIDEM
ncbi:MAG: hypothetical protein LBT80_07570 [Lactobacillaceae bacterium]|jgi:hypothetical protein|nr:hypothetical protein [Lactobacillaceae bacterium]